MYELFYDGENIFESEDVEKIKKALQECRQEFINDAEHDNEIWGDPLPTEESVHEYLLEMHYVSKRVPLEEFL